MAETTIDINDDLEIRLAPDGIEITQRNGVFPGSQETVSLHWNTFDAVMTEAVEFLRELSARSAAEEPGSEGVNS